MAPHSTTQPAGAGRRRRRRRLRSSASTAEGPAFLDEMARLKAREGQLDDKIARCRARREAFARGHASDMEAMRQRHHEELVQTRADLEEQVRQQLQVKDKLALAKGRQLLQMNLRDHREQSWRNRCLVRYQLRAKASVHRSNQPKQFLAGASLRGFEAFTAMPHRQERRESSSPRSGDLG